MARRRKMRLARARLGGLGSPPKTHQKRALDALRAADQLANSATESMERGACGIAYTQASKALYGMGVYEAELVGGGKGVVGKKAVDQVRTKISRTIRLVMSQCFRPDQAVPEFDPQEEELLTQEVEQIQRDAPLFSRRARAIARTARMRHSRLFPGVPAEPDQSFLEPEGGLFTHRVSAPVPGRGYAPVHDQPTPALRPEVPGRGSPRRALYQQMFSDLVAQGVPKGHAYAVIAKKLGRTRSSVRIGIHGRRPQGCPPCEQED